MKEPREYQDMFISAFARAISDEDKNLSSRDRDLPDEYTDMLCEIAVYVWQERNDKDSVYSLKKLQENCQFLLDVGIRSNSKSAKLICLKMVCDVYETLYYYAVEELSNATNKHNKVNRQEFKIINKDNVHQFCEQILQEFDLETLQQIDIPALLNHMMVTDLALFKERSNGNWIADYAIFQIKFFIGRYLARLVSYSDIYEVFVKSFLLGII